MFNSCLICTSLTDGLQRLIKFTPELAAVGFKKVVFLHIVPYIDDREIPKVNQEKIDRVRTKWEQLLPVLPQDLTVNLEVITGQSPGQIIEIANKHQVDLIITGMETKNLLEEKLFGSNTLALAKNQSRPILILRPQLINSYSDGELSIRCQELFKSVLLPYDGSDSAQKSLAMISDHLNNSVTPQPEIINLCWVINDARLQGLTADYQQNTAEAELVKIQGKLHNDRCQINYQIKLGDPITETINSAIDTDSRVIVISSDNLGKLTALSNSSFAAQIIRNSWRPVLFLPKTKS